MLKPHHSLTPSLHSTVLCALGPTYMDHVHMVEILNNGDLLHISSLSTLSWELEIGHGRTVCTMAIDKCYKSALLITPE